MDLTHQLIQSHFSFLFRESRYLNVKVKEFNSLKEHCCFLEHKEEYRCYHLEIMVENSNQIHFCTYLKYVVYLGHLISCIKMIYFSMLKEL